MLIYFGAPEKPEKYVYVKICIWLCKDATALYLFFETLEQILFNFNVC